METSSANSPASLVARLTAATNAHDDTIWTEWDHCGARRDGTKHLMRGVIILGVAGGLATWAVRRQVIAGQGAKA